MHQLAAMERAKQRGFTLAELAIVLVIITILASALSVPLLRQLEGHQRKQTAGMLEDIQAALIGFAITKGRLPCIADAIPTSPAYGTEDYPACPAREGVLPWRTLGIAPHDAWSQLWRYRIDPKFSETIKTDTETSKAITVQDHDENDLTIDTQSAVALVYSWGSNGEPNGLNSSSPPPYEQGEPTRSTKTEPEKPYDDMVIWLGRPLLIARMAEAGKFE